MKRKAKLFIAGTVITLTMFGLITTVHARVTDPVGSDCCDSGTTGLCWIITVNGVASYKCKATTGTEKDCNYVAPA